MSAQISHKERQRARRRVLQALYQRDFHEGAVSEDLLCELAGGPVEGEVRACFEAMVEGVLREEDRLDKMLAPALDRGMDDLDTVEKILLRMGAWELGEVAGGRAAGQGFKQVLSAHIALAGLFGGEDSYKYINAVLDKVAARLELKKTRVKA